MDINLQEMENKQEYYSCFSYYDSKKRRIAAFAQIVDGELELFILTCSRKDSFNKKIAKGIYKLGRYATVKSYNGLIPHPQIFTIPLNGKHPKAAFLSYLSDNYYKPYPIWKVVRHVYLNKQQRDETFQLINSML